MDKTKVTVGEIYAIKGPVAALRAMGHSGLAADYKKAKTYMNDVQDMLFKNRPAYEKVKLKYCWAIKNELEIFLWDNRNKLIEKKQYTHGKRKI